MEQILLLGIFIIGIAAIALEDKLGINKAAIAILMAVSTWLIVTTTGMIPDPIEPFVKHLGEVSETLFFVLGSLTLIEIVDAHGGFKSVVSFIKTRKKRSLLWIICLMSFFFSALLDNIAAAVIIISIVRKLVPTREERLIFAGMIIISCNAGGAFSPIGDVTTIILWTAGNITAPHQVTHLLLPAFTCMVVPLFFVARHFGKNEKWDPIEGEIEDNSIKISHTSRLLMLSWAIATMVSVPFFQYWSALPPFMPVMFGLAVLWIYTDIMYNKHPEIKSQMTMCDALKKADLSTILFFLGILMTVGALETSQILTKVGALLENVIGSPLGVSFAIGAMSSMVDNVALVAATQGMYPITEAGTYMVNSEFWTFLAYTAVTGGSLLIIGSATGVTVMGMEKISFSYYFKKFSIYALIGFVSGSAMFLLLRHFVLNS